MSSSISVEIGQVASSDGAIVVELGDGEIHLVEGALGGATIAQNADMAVERAVAQEAAVAKEAAIAQEAVIESDCVSLKQFGIANGSLLEHTCLFVDCQTTGASPAAGGNLLEVAWCTGSASGAIGSDISSHLIAQPDEELIPFRIQSLTGITDDAMAEAIACDELVQRLLSTEPSLSSPQLCVIHYARFETPFLKLLMQEHGENQPWPFQLVCTFEIARRLYPNLPSRGIRALGGFLGIDMEEVKRAPSHVSATRVIWTHLVECLSQIGIDNLEQLQEFLSTKARGRTGKLEYKLEPLKRLELPNCPGVYRMLSQNGRVLYVGKATSLKSRVNSHFRGRKKKTSKSKELLTQVAEIDVTECGSPLEAALLETDEIKKFDPPYNISLKQRSRSLLFASPDFLSFSERQDVVHTIGPMPNPRALDALLRLNATINSGIVDPLMLFEEIPVEDLVDGIDVFLERHLIRRVEGSAYGTDPNRGVTGDADGTVLIRSVPPSPSPSSETPMDAEDGMTPRMLLALGLRLFRSTKKIMRQLAIERALAKAKAEESLTSEGKQQVRTSQPDAASLDHDTSESEHRLAEIGRSLIESEEFDEAVFDESAELTPEEIADRLDSLLIGIARTYLVSKEMTGLLNSTLRFEYRSQSRDLIIRDGKVAQKTLMVSERTNDAIDKVGCLWSDLDIRDYDRMRVLLTEITRMQTSKATIEVTPALVVLSRW